MEGIVMLSVSYAECHIQMLSVIMLDVVMLSAVGPKGKAKYNCRPH
jgi:hypothetical protein